MPHTAIPIRDTRSQDDEARASHGYPHHIEPDQTMQMSLDDGLADWGEALSGLSSQPSPVTDESGTSLFDLICTAFGGD